MKCCEDSCRDSAEGRALILLFPQTTFLGVTAVFFAVMFPLNEMMKQVAPTLQMVWRGLAWILSITETSNARVLI